MQKKVSFVLLLELQLCVNMFGRRLSGVFFSFFFFNDQLLSLISILSRSSLHFFVFLQQYETKLTSSWSSGDGSHL